MTDSAITQAAVTANLDQAIAGDERAFAQLIAEHDGPMVRTAFVITGDVEAARDATQCAWITAWRRLDTVREPERIRHWLVAIAANEARQLVRGRGRRRLREVSGPPPTDSAPDPADGIDQVDLARALAALEPDDRAVLAMRYVGGFDARDIASYTGLTPSGVRSRLSRILDRLRKELDDD